MGMKKPKYVILFAILFLALGLVFWAQRTAAPAQLVVALNPSSPLAMYGVESGDILFEINAQKISRYSELSPLLARQPADQPLNMKFKKHNSEDILDLALASHSFEWSEKGLGLDSAATLVQHIREGSVAEKLGLRARDKILFIQGVRYSEQIDCPKLQTSVRNEKKVLMTVYRTEGVYFAETPELFGEFADSLGNCENFRLNSDYLPALGIKSFSP